MWLPKLGLWAHSTFSLDSVFRAFCAHPAVGAQRPSGGAHPICFRCGRPSRRWYQTEGALECVFQGMPKLSIRCVVTSGQPRSGHRLPLVGPEPSCRTRQEEHALSIVRDQFRSAIPPRVALRHCPLPLHRHGQNKAIAQSQGWIYHRTVNSVLTVCLTGGAHPTCRPTCSPCSLLVRSILY